MKNRELGVACYSYLIVIHWFFNGPSINHLVQARMPLDASQSWIALKETTTSFKIQNITFWCHQPWLNMENPIEMEVL